MPRENVCRGSEDKRINGSRVGTNSNVSVECCCVWESIYNGAEGSALYGKDFGYPITWTEMGT